ncbi:MAG: protein phosphatase 2C domain-containing protein [Gammaproteobacteria bacterium]|jgi:PPM family protein phosphatase|nr:protein phosphatase 2C domain-containing protein [Gammaproteobacteria bacterium]MBU0772887.1 protein phosphatase 2C domain-containing protein [Gammaproteobacteria bacterium]MBU0854827.1 protein phosphatase 2C domain-containing protein [Gammaproteobacteria bacterium]MBU1847629.1 protein phosphatase 2C domain-containing protein [Gammaproteobacteria bacterium]
MALKLDSCVAQHIGDRKEQQDRAAVFPHSRHKGMLMAALADGMGGHSGGAMAAEQVILKARENFESYAPSVETPEQLLRSIVEEAHVVIKLTRFTSEQDPHSTACVLLLQSGRADWAHCGDSRIYHFRNDMKMASSSDHSLVGELMRQGKLDEEGAKSHPQRNLLLHCLGAQKEPVIDYGGCSTLADGDSFMICSDGMWAYFSDEEIGGVLSVYSAREAAEVFIKRARERGRPSGDNVSLIIMKLVDVEARQKADQVRLDAARRKLGNITA